MKIPKSDDQKNIRVVQFLEAYEKQENLWNPGCETYKNKAARDTSYMRIIEDLGKPSLTISDIKLKIKSIRTTYTKELRLVTKHKEQGKPYIPKLFWFNRANSFLKDVSLSRDKRVIYNETFKHAGADSFKTSVMDYMTDDPVDDLSHVDHDGSDSNTYEYKTLSTDNIAQQLHTDIQLQNVHAVKNSIMPQNSDFSISTVGTNVVSSNSNCAKYADTRYSNMEAQYHNNHSGTQTAMLDDEFDLFCRSVAAQLRSISDIYSRSVAKLKIQQILFEAETGHYRNTSVTIPTVTESQQLNAI